MITVSLSGRLCKECNAELDLVGVVREDGKDLWFVYQFEFQYGDCFTILTVGQNEIGFYYDLDDLLDHLKIREENTGKKLEFVRFIPKEVSKE